MNGVDGTSRTPDTAAIAKNQSEHMVASSEKLNSPEQVLGEKGLEIRDASQSQGGLLDKIHNLRKRPASVLSKSGGLGLLGKRHWVRPKIRSVSAKKTIEGHEVKQIGDNGKNPRLTFIFTGSGMGMTVGGRNFSGRRVKQLTE